MTSPNQYNEILDLHVFGEDQPIGSTQDETKRLLSERDASSTKLLAVLAEKQLNGRGTQGRKWEGPPGNVYLTVAVPMEEIPVTITLLPLQIGTLVAQTLQKHVSTAKVNVKWPNDVLVDDRKIAGVLIENWLSPSDHACWLVVGIGVNVAFAPELPSGIRPAVCLQSIFNNLQDTNNVLSATQIGTDLVHSLLDWMKLASSGSKQAAEAQLLQEWRSLVEFGQIYMIRETGEEVTTLDVKSDGQLLVRGSDGRERFLMADYLH